MASQTSNYNLVKPATTEAIDVSQINGNMDIIDSTMAGLQTGVNSAVKVSSQTLTDAEKAQARTNIGAANATETVLTTEQTLTSAQQTQARTNISAASAEELAQLMTVTDEPVTMNYGLSAQVKKTGRICMARIYGQVNTAVSQWGIIGSRFPNPAAPVIVPNSVGSELSYLNLTETGTLQIGSSLVNGSYVLITFTYITAN